MNEKEAFTTVEKEFLAEFDELNNRIFNKTQPTDKKSTTQYQFENVTILSIFYIVA